MKDIRRSLKILRHKYGLWIILIALVCIIIQTAMLQSNLESINRSLKEAYVELPRIDMKLNEGKNLQKEDFDKDKKKFNVEDIKNLNNLALKNYDKAMDSENGEYISTIEFYELFLNDYGDYPISERDYYYYNSVDPARIFTEITQLNGTNLLTLGNYIVVIFAIFLGIFLSSAEHLTSFYKFSRTLPWARWKNLLAKTLLGSITILLMSAIALISNYFMLKNSDISQLLTFKNMYTVYFPVIMNLGIYFLVLGIGTLAGNFLGHIGMLIIAYTGINLYTWDIEMTYQIFARSNRSYIPGITRFIEKLERLPVFLRTMLMPVKTISVYYSTDIISVSLGMLLLGLCYLLIGFLYNQRSNPERSGVMVLPPLLSKIVFVIAVITTTALISNIVLFISGGSLLYSFIGYIAFALILFMSVKVYRMLFKVRIGV